MTENINDNTICEKSFHDNGKLFCERILSKSLEQIGLSKLYHEDEKLYSVTNYESDKRVGPQVFTMNNSLFKEFYYSFQDCIRCSGGSGLTEVFYKEDKPHGDKRLFNNKGKLIKKLPYENGLKNGNEELFFSVFKLSIKWNKNKFKGIKLGLVDKRTTTRDMQFIKNNLMTHYNSLCKNYNHPEL